MILRTVKRISKSVSNTGYVRKLKRSMDSVEIAIANPKPVHDFKAKADVTACLICRRRFNSDDVRTNVYKDDKFMGVIHDTCYELYGEVVSV